MQHRKKCKKKCKKCGGKDRLWQTGSHFSMGKRWVCYACMKDQIQEAFSKIKSPVTAKKEKLDGLVKCKQHGRYYEQVKHSRIVGCVRCYLEKKLGRNSL